MMPALVNVTGHDADLAFIRRDDAWAVRPDQAALGSFKRPFDLHHVHNRNAFGDADHQRHFRINRFQDCVCREGRRHVDHAGIDACRVLRFLNGVEHRQAQMRLATFAGSDAADHVRAVFNGGAGMERALAASKTLANHPGRLY